VAKDRGEQKARALWYTAPGSAEIREEPVGPMRPGEVRVRTLFSSISRGTEALISQGRVPDTEYERMRAPFMGGAFPYPVKYGYSNVGRVEAGPDALVGRNVFSLFPHQSEFVVPAEGVVPVPDGVSPLRAVLGANMETALNAIWDGRPGPADRIAVVGAGVVGALAAWLCGRLPGAQVTIVDVNPARAELAEKLGVGFAAPGKASGDHDLVIHASGYAGGLAEAFSLAGDEATVLDLSWYGAGDVPVPLGGAFHSRRLKLVSSQVGKVAPSHRPRWTHRRRLEAALALLADPALDVLLAPPIPLAQLPARLPHVLSSGSGVLCQPVDYSAV
jgi:NADPH:quinone reductase-like Zn-dependent oxidoreductase